MVELEEYLELLRTDLKEIHELNGVEDSFFHIETVEYLLTHIERLLKDNKELTYRIDTTSKLLEAAKCPQECTGSCAWCYDREVEIKSHKMFLKDDE